MNHMSAFKSKNYINIENINHNNNIMADPNFNLSNNKRLKYRFGNKNVFVIDKNLNLSKTFIKLVGQMKDGMIPFHPAIKTLRKSFYGKKIFNNETNRFVKKSHYFRKNGQLRDRFVGEFIVSNGGRSLSTPPPPPIRLFEAKVKQYITKFNDSIKYKNFEMESDPPTNNRAFYDAIMATIRNEEIKGDIVKEYVNIAFIKGDDRFARSIPIDSFASFNNAMNKIAEGLSASKSGSDIIGEGTVPDTTFFQYVHVLASPAGGGNPIEKVSSKSFVVKNYESVDNNCFIACMVNKRYSMKDCDKLRKQIFHTYGIEYGTKIKITDLPKMEEFFETKINVYLDDGSILYQGKPTMNDGVNLLLKDGHYTRIIKKKKQKKKKKKKKQQKKKTLLFFYDLETIFDKKDVNFLKPYSASWFVHNPEQEFKYDEAQHFNECSFSSGKNCMDDLMNAILSCPKGFKYIICGFNSSKFDNFFLADTACQKLMLDKTDFMYVNNSILSMSIAGGHKVFDLCRFVATSLKKACDSFKTNPSKMDGYSHNVPQDIFNKGGFEALDKFIDENYDYVERYNKLDVLSLCDLLMKVREGVMTLFNGEIITDYMTIGQMAYNCFTNPMNNDFELNRPNSLEDDLFIRKALCAGRTQAYFGRNKYQGALKMVDVKSLYPFVMMNRAFPIGDYKKTDEYVEGALGIYRVKVIHQNMKWQDENVMNISHEYKREYAPIVYPLRSEDPAVPLNWNYRGEFEANMTSVDIDCIRRNGGEIEVYEGIYWEQSSDQVFINYLEPLMNEKNRQDTLKKKPEYNPALRELCKLFSNCLSGKVIQKNYEDVFQREAKPQAPSN